MTVAEVQQKIDKLKDDIAQLCKGFEDATGFCPIRLDIGYIKPMGYKPIVNTFDITIEDESTTITR